jgi:hypothetical protein
MKELLDAFWRAVAYCLHPKVILLSLLPLLIAAGGAVLLGYLYWDGAVGWTRALLDGWTWLDVPFGWFASVSADFRKVLAPLMVIAVAAPMIVVLSLLLVALLMTPTIVNLVSARRFPLLERRHGASMLASVSWSTGCTIVALVLIVLSMPLWLIPPLVLVLPPLIWGWLAYRVMSFDALAEHASGDERRAILRKHRLPLWGIGIVTGYLGAAPSLVWALGALTLVLAPILIVASVWLYTLVFAFSALWFAHYVLAALQQERSAMPPIVRPPEPPLLHTVDVDDPPALPRM